KAVGEELCPQLGLTIPVGKDSMSMKTRWQEGNETREMTSPLSLVITAFARVEDVRHTVTPQLSTDDNALLLIDLGEGHNALGATALAQVYRQLGDKPADVRDPAKLKGFYDAIQALVAQRKLLAYHDRSDGGLLVTLAEMAFTGHCGVEADIATLGNDRLAALFNEELGAVIQVAAADRAAVEQILTTHGLGDCVHYLGKAVAGDR
ncbi:AIR synthase-related protein, partial [Atlantibacter subterraneus]